MRSDRRRNLLTVARVLGWAATGTTTRPTRARTALRAGISERSVSKHWRWLEEAGWIHCTEQGTTADYRPSWARDEGNLARTFTLTLPETSPRSLISERKVRATPAAAFPQGNPKTISEKGWAAEARRFRSALWTDADIRFAVDHAPSGARWAMDDPVRYPRAHLRWRLAWWLAPDGTPLPSRSQLAASRRSRELAEQAARREERAIGLARAGDYAGQAAKAREMLAEVGVETGSPPPT
jgi:hypothetical protein